MTEAIWFAGLPTLTDNFANPCYINVIQLSSFRASKINNVKLDIDQVKISNTNYSNNIIKRAINNLEQINSLIHKTYPEDDTETNTNIKKILMKEINFYFQNFMMKNG